MDGLILVLSVGALLAMLGALVPGFGSDTRDGYGRSRDPRADGAAQAPGQGVPSHGSGDWSVR